MTQHANRETFAASEAGAVTVDWVVLTAGLVGLGLATMGLVSSGVEDASGDVRDEMSGYVIQTTFAPFFSPFDTSRFDTVRDEYLATDADGYINDDDWLILQRGASRTYAMDYIDLDNQAMAELMMDRVYGMEAAAYERGIPALTGSPTRDEMLAAHAAQFGS